ncbi:MAG TPA: sodium:solute symporter family protein [Phycisphaerales bacterium]|nr:sodium:solute symporter family protein [Phycisphaerales bacterium]
MISVGSAAVVAGFVGVLAWVAFRTRAVRQFREFSLAGRRIGLPLVFGSLAAAYVGPGFSVGFVGKGFQSGFLFLGIGLAYALQNIVVGMLVAPRLRAMEGCHTLGDAIGQKYDRRCQLFAGVVSVGICVFLAAVMVYAGSEIVQNTLGLPRWTSTTLLVGVAALYTTSGGLRASILTNSFQFVLFSILLPVVLLVVFFQIDGGSATFAREALAATRAGWENASAWKIAGLLTAFLLGETLIPPYANRALASQSVRVSRGGFILAGLYSVAWFTVMAAIGIAARGRVSPDVIEDHVLLVLVRDAVPPTGYTLMMLALVSVVMSSLDALLNAGAVAFARDLAPKSKRGADHRALRTGRVATIVMAIIAAVVSPMVPSIIEGLLICYTIWASAILPSLLAGLLLDRPRPLAGLLSMAVGTLAALVGVIAIFVKASFMQTPIIIVPALAASMAAYGVGHALDRSRKVEVA